MAKDVVSHAGLLMEAFGRSHKILEKYMAQTPPKFALRLTLGQLRVLHYLMQNEPVSMRALAEHERVVMSTMTDMANRLVRMGLVQRKTDSKDRRVVLLELTPRGRKEFSTKAEFLRKRFIGLLTLLKRVEREELVKAIQTVEKILARINEKNEKP